MTSGRNEASGVRPGESEGFSVSMARRVALWGPTFVGFLGIVLALNAALADEYVGAGVNLAASGVAFGLVGYIFLRE